jgi:hypothetical protein
MWHHPALPNFVGDNLEIEINLDGFLPGMSIQTSVVRLTFGGEQLICPEEQA